MRAVCRLVLRLSGVLVFVAGILHLWMTDHVVQLLASMEPGETSDVARAAMQLNHLVVGILLLPLGVSLAVIARPLARREPWARTIGLANWASMSPSALGPRATRRSARSAAARRATSSLVSPSARVPSRTSSSSAGMLQK